MFQACKRIGLLGFLGSLALVGCGGAADVQSDADPVQSLAVRAGAPLFEGMGDYHMPITTADPDAQRYFDQGMVLAFGFNHAESIRSFRAAQTLDPACAMCFWGLAYAHAPFLNHPIKPGADVAAGQGEREARGAQEGARHRARQGGGGGAAGRGRVSVHHQVFLFRLNTSSRILLSS